MHQILRFILLSVSLVLCTSTVRYAEASATLNACFLFPNTLYDLGFTYSGNVARRNALGRLQAAYPLAAIASFSMFDCKLGNFTDALQTMIDKRRCNLVLSVTNECFAQLPSRDAFFAAYPAVKFVHYLNQNYFGNPSTLPPNFRAIGVSPHEAWYAAGAAAAAQCRTCIGFVHPLTTTITAPNAFYRGMKFGSANFRRNASAPMCPLYVMSTGSFLDVDLESTLARLFTERGCDVVAYWADSQSISSYVGALNDPRIFSVAINVDAARLSGDSALTSVILDLSDVIYSFGEDIINGAPLERKYVTARNGSTIATISPRAVRNASRAASAALAAQKDNYTVWCGGFTDDTGVVRYTGCGSDALMSSFRYTEMGIVNFGRIASATACPAGTSASYHVQTNFTLSCVACTDGTFSDRSGATSCSVCGPHLRPNANRTGCVAVEGGGDRLSASDRALIIAFSVFGAVAVAVATVLVVRRLLFADGDDGSLGSQWRQLSPPTSEHVAFVALAVNRVKSVEKWRQDITFACSVFEALEDAVFRACKRYDGFVAFSAADVYILATPSTDAAVRIARMIESRFGGGDGMIALRFVLHAGRPVVVQSADAASPKNSDGAAVGPADGSGGGQATGGFEGRLRYQGAVVSELLFAFSNFKADCAASIVALPSCFTIRSTAAAVATSGPSAGGGASSVVAADATQAPRGAANTIELLELIQRHADCLFGVAQWPKRCQPRDATGSAVQQVTTITTPETVAFQALAEHRGRHPSGSGGDGGAAALGGGRQDNETASTAASSGATAGVESDGIVFDAQLLTEAEMLTFLRLGTSITRIFLSILEVPHRKQLVRAAAMRMHIILNVNAARRKDPVTHKVFFGEEQVVREIVAQVLRTMDEQELQWWLKETAALRTRK